MPHGPRLSNMGGVFRGYFYGQRVRYPCGRAPAMEHHSRARYLTGRGHTETDLTTYPNILLGRRDQSHSTHSCSRCRVCKSDGPARSTE